jgi:hypothetical protein
MIMIDAIAATRITIGTVASLIASSYRARDGTTPRALAVQRVVQQSDSLK